MNAPYKDQTTGEDLELTLRRMGLAARAAARVLAKSDKSQRAAALHAMAKALLAREKNILAANGRDLEQAARSGVSPAFIERMKLSREAIHAMANGIETVAWLADPIGDAEAEWTRPNGLKIARVRVPIGVIGIIYESRPNVTADAAALCVKSGNAVILRGGSEAFGSARAIQAALVEGLERVGLPADAVQLVPTADRAAVGYMLGGLDGAIDVIIPRGGKSLVARVQKDARVPVLAHLDGNCHVYVDKAADVHKALDIVLNSKMRRVSVCGAAETLLIDAAGAGRLLRPLVLALLDAECEVRGDRITQTVDPRVQAAEEDDWYTEFLDAIIAVRVVEGVDAAIAHIGKYGSSHTDTIVTEDKAAAETFLREVDSAIVLHNASTQFADGAEFGFGAEIGIATGRLHARGPVGARELTTYKYVVRGDGQVRP
ncbi:MAG: glutamate-5-semialdehyde dehydrogenase [Alphaproteobacteria bacterium]|nr:glutamate-5-semialdehyde dehydrogenase [Alphaproteobacteria bacterium]